MIQAVPCSLIKWGGSVIKYNHLSPSGAYLLIVRYYIWFTTRATLMHSKELAVRASAVMNNTQHLDQSILLVWQLPILSEISARLSHQPLLCYHAIGRLQRRERTTVKLIQAKCARGKSSLKNTLLNITTSICGLLSSWLKGRIRWSIRHLAN